MILSLGAVYVLVDSTGTGERVGFGPNEEVLYIDGANEADARALGAALQASGVFDGTRELTAQVRRPKDAYIVSFVVREGAWDEPLVQEAFRSVCRDLSDTSFHGSPVEIWLCDDNMEGRRRISR